MRKVVIAGCVAGGLTGITLLLASVPAVQTLLTRHALATGLGPGNTIERAAVSLQAIHLENLEVQQPGFRLTVPRAEIELSVWDLLRKRAAVRRLVAQGWTLDLTAVQEALVSGANAEQPEPTKPEVMTAGVFPNLLAGIGGADSAGQAESAARQVFSGLLADHELPWALDIDGLDLVGTVLLPAPMTGGPPVRVEVTLTGGGLHAGQTGHFELRAQGQADDPASALGKFFVSLDSDLRLASPRELALVAIDMTTRIAGGEFPEGAGGRAKARIEVDGGREQYVLELLSEGRPLVRLAAALDLAQAAITGTWNSRLATADLLPFAMGYPLPRGSIAGQGTFTLGTDWQDIRVAGQLDAAVTQPGEVDPRLAAMGELNLSGTFDLWQTGSLVRVTGLDVLLTEERPVLRLRSLQDFAYDLETAELKVAHPERDLMQLALAGLPLRWVDPLISSVVVAGHDLRGEVLLGARQGGLVAYSAQPLTLQDVSVATLSTPLLDDLQIAFGLRGDYTLQGWQAELQDVEVTSAGRRLLKGGLRMGRRQEVGAPAMVTARFAGDVGGLLRQPMFAGRFALSEGVAEGLATATIGPEMDIGSRLVLREGVDLAGRRLPRLVVDMQATRGDTPSWHLRVPVRIEHEGRLSDLAFTSDVELDTAGLVFDGDLVGEHLNCRDLVTLLAALQPPQTGSGEATSAYSAIQVDRPMVAPWSGLTGTLGLKIGQLDLANALAVRQVSGQVTVDAAAMRLTSLTARLNDGKLLTSGKVEFVGQAALPLQLTGRLAVDDLEVGALFRAYAPSEPPTVEGIFQVRSLIEAQAVTLPELSEALRGDFQLSSRGGRFRALNANITERAQQVQQSSALLGSLIAAATGRDKAANYAERVNLLADVAAALADIPFDQLNVDLRRSADLTTQLRDFTLIAPEVRLQGSGAVQAIQGMSILQQPLQVQLQLGAQGKMAESMAKLGLLGTGADSLGYQPFFAPVELEGTLLEVSTSKLKSMLMQRVLAGSTDAGSSGGGAGLLRGLFGGK